MDKIGDKYYISKALEVAEYSTCFKNHVGAIIVKYNKIISTGFNGTPDYQKNCIEIGFCYRNRHNIESATELERCRAVGSHAESNAISFAAKKGISINNAIIYVVGHNTICNQCKAMIANSGIKQAILMKQDNEIIKYSPKNDWNIHPVDLEE